MDGEVYHGFSNSACEVGYMHMNDSDFQTLGAASILTNKVSEWKGETEKKWDGYHIFEEAKKGDKLCLLAIDEMVDILGEGIANICYVINPEVMLMNRSTHILWHLKKTRSVSRSLRKNLRIIRN